MNENKKKSKAWPLAAAALALGLGGVVGASAVYADRADDAANIQPAQSVKMRVDDSDSEKTDLIVEFGNYVSDSNEVIAVNETVEFLVPSGDAYVGSNIDDALEGLNTIRVEPPQTSLDSTIVISLAGKLQYDYAEVEAEVEGTSVYFIFQRGALSNWRVDLYDENYYNVNYVPKDLIGQTFDAVTGGVTGVAGNIVTGVTSVVGLFWDVENVRFTTLGTLTLVGLAAGLVYFAIRTIYRAVNGVA